MPFSSSFVWELAVSGGNVGAGGCVVDSSGRITTASNYTYTINWGPDGSFTNPQSFYVSPAIFQYNSFKQHQWHLPFLTTAATTINDMAIDSAGNIIAIGAFIGGPAAYPGVPARSVVIPSTTGPGITLTNTASSGTNDIFLAKWSPAGLLLWAKNFGGTPAAQNGNDLGLSVKIDSLDNIIIGCSVSLPPADPFHPTPGTIDFGGTSTPFSGTGGHSWAIASIDGNTGLGIWAQVWGTNVNGSFPVSPWSINIATDGQVLVSGFSQDTNDLGLGYGVVTSTTAGWGLFLGKYSSTDGHCLWVKTYGNGGVRQPAVGMTVDPSSGSIFITGDASGRPDFGFGQLPVPGEDPYTHAAQPYYYLAMFDNSGVGLWQTYELTGISAYGTKCVIGNAGNLFVAGNGNGFGSFGLPAPVSIRGPWIWGLARNGSSSPVPQFIDNPSAPSGIPGGVTSYGGNVFVASSINGGNFSLYNYTCPGGSVAPDPANFTPVYAPSANTTFQSKFGFIWNGTLPPTATNILIKYSFPAGTITPGPGETTPFLLLNYPEPSGYFGPNAYGFVYKVTGGDGPTWGPGYTTILNWSWAAAFADASGTAIGPYTAWQNVTKSAAVNVTNNGTVASTPYANPKVTTNPTNRGNLQSISLS